MPTRLPTPPWIRYEMIRYRELNVDGKDDKIEQTPVPSKYGPSPKSVKTVQEPERLWKEGFVKLMSFKSGVKGRGSDRW